jgi:hypothetical protein
MAACHARCAAGRARGVWAHPQRAVHPVVCGVVCSACGACSGGRTLPRPLATSPRLLGAQPPHDYFWLAFGSTWALIGCCTRRLRAQLARCEGSRGPEVPADHSKLLAGSNYANESWVAQQRAPPDLFAFVQLKITAYHNIKLKTRVCDGTYNIVHARARAESVQRRRRQGAPTLPPQQHWHAPTSHPQLQPRPSTCCSSQKIHLHKLGLCCRHLPPRGVQAQRLRRGLPGVQRRPLQCWSNCSSFGVEQGSRL